LALQDIYRSDLINSEKTDGFDRFQALAESGKYIRNIHDDHSGIGEVLANDIIFKEHEDGRVGEPVLNMPDIIFNKDKNIGEKEKKATDILDFIFSVGARCSARRSVRALPDQGSVRTACRRSPAGPCSSRAAPLCGARRFRGRGVRSGRVRQRGRR